MGDDTKIDDASVASITEDMEEWAKNVILSYKNPKEHYIMLADGIITIQDVDIDEPQKIINPQ